MKVYDCFMYCDENTVLDIRLNCLDAYVDKFVIVESKLKHSGKKRILNSVDDEFNEAIIQVGKIANLRLNEINIK